MKAENRICPYCKAEVKSLDFHVRNVEVDNNIGSKVMRITCVLTRYYLIEPSEQK